MADAIHDLEMQRVLGERDSHIKRAITSLATRLGVDTDEIDTIVSDLKESEVTVEQRVIYDIKNRFRTRLQPIMSLSQNEANHKDFEINMFSHENNRLLQRSTEESRQIRLHDGSGAQFIQIGASPQLPFGAAALHQPPPPVLNVDPTLAAQRKLPGEAARYVIEDESYIGFIPGTSRRYDRPLEYPVSVKLELFANQVAAARVPVTKTIDYLRLVKEIISRAEQVGLTDHKLRQGFILVCDEYFQHLVDPLQRLKDPKIFFDCLADFINLTTNRVQIQTALNQLTRQPNENFCTPLRTHLSLQLMKFEISHPGNTEEENMRRAKRVVRNLSTVWMSPPCAKKYLLWVKTRMDTAGKTPELDEIINIVNRIETEPGMALEHAQQMSSADANRIELFKFAPRGRGGEVVDHHAAGAGSDRVLPSGWGGRDQGFPMYTGRSRESSRGRDSGYGRPPSSTVRPQDQPRQRSRNRSGGERTAEQTSSAASSQGSVYAAEAKTTVSGQGVPVTTRPRTRSAGDRRGSTAAAPRPRSSSRGSTRGSSQPRATADSRTGRSTSRPGQTRSRERPRSKSNPRNESRARDAANELSALVGRQELLIARLKADKRALVEKYESAQAVSTPRDPFRPN